MLSDQANLEIPETETRTRRRDRCPRSDQITKPMVIRIRLNASLRNAGLSNVSSRSRWAMLLTIAGAIALILGLAFTFLSSPSGPVAQNPPASTAQKPESNQSADQALKFNGVKRTKLADGTVVIAKAGAEYSVPQPRRLRLEQGELYLIVAKSETPFVVETADGEVRATGTRFMVSAGDKTEAAVAQGTVELESSDGEISLGAGQRGTLVKSEKPTRRPAKRLSYLVNWAKDALAQEELLVKTLPRENGLVAIDPYGQEAKLSLRKYHVDVYIEDGIARTTIDQTFFNHNPWNTEGTFYFPLPQDASVSRLAMYVFGKLNEGGMVTRQRGQQIYNDILYQRRDPALLEMMEGNMFKMRIFPLEGRQEKRIFLSYTQNLKELYGQIKYMFPMEHTSEVAGELSIRVHVKDGAKQFDPRSSTHELKTTIDGDDVVLEFDAKKVKPDQDFLLNLLPKADKPKAEVRVATCKKDGKHYFSAKLTPELTGLNQPAPRQWIVLNDVSASRSQIDIATQRYVLERLVAEADDDDSVFLIDVNTLARKISQSPVNVRSADIKSIVNHRPKRVIGATDLAASFKAAGEVVREHGLTNPYILYLGDGVATDGEKSISELSRAIPSICKFVGVGVGKKVDSLFLQTAADRTGGTFTTINANEDVDWRVFDLLASMNTTRMTNIKVELLDKDDRLIDAIVYPSASILAAGETLTVTAMSESAFPSAVRFKGRVGTELITKTAQVSDAKTNADYLPRLWAKRHIDELLKSDMSDKEDIISLSKEFYIVTPYTSLIVLEDDKMYEEYNVERGRTDHWAAYDAPKEIDVVREPLPRTNRWWGQLEGEDNRVKVSAKPKTVQQIIDNIQIRVDAPFYVWDVHTPYESPQTSRTGLCQLCDLPKAGDSDRAELLTLYFLLAGGDRDTAMKLEQVTDDGARSKWIADRIRRTMTETKTSPKLPLLALDNSWSMKSRLANDITGSFEGGGAITRREVTLNRLSVRPGDLINVHEIRSSERRLRAANIFAAGGPAPRIVLTPADGSMATFGPKLLLRYDLGVTLESLRATDSLTPKISSSARQAIDNRWTRLKRDIHKYNFRYHWGGTLIDADGSTNINSFPGGESLGGFLDRNGRSLSNLFLSGFSQDQGIIPSFYRRGLVNDWEIDVDGDGLKDRYWEAFNWNALDINRPFGDGVDNTDVMDGLSNTMSIIETSRGGFLTTSSFDLDKPFYNFLHLAPIQFELPHNLVAEPRKSIADQPGLNAILAADHLVGRLKELDRLASEQPDGLSKSQLALQRAMQVAIKDVGRVGARLESTAPFWGYQGRSYRPLPPTVNLPSIQIAQNWSSDLTRYAQGLYSTPEDMIAEVTRQYGTRPAIGKIDAASKRLIQQAREKFNPVEIQFADDGTKYKVGPNNQFAFSTTSDMNLTERFVCDGKQIVQIYDELGLASRRPATRSRLESLQQLVPHLISDVDSFTQSYDVQMVETNEDETTIKITLAAGVKPEQNEETISKDLDEQQTGNQKKTPHMVIRFDNQGRVISRQLMVDDTAISATWFDYGNDQVTVKWKVQVKSKLDSDAQTNLAIDKAIKFETGEKSYSCKALDTDESTFAIELDPIVVIDMPLMKPDFYQQKIAKLIEGAEQQGTEELDLTKLDRETALELIPLYQHLTLSGRQENSINRGGRGWAHLQTTEPRFKQLKQYTGQPFLIGELAIFGGIGRGSLDQMFGKTALQGLMTTDLYRFRNSRSDVVAQNRTNGLIGHINAYREAFQSQAPAGLKKFRERFEESPLTLGLAYQMYGSKFQNRRAAEAQRGPTMGRVGLNDGGFVTRGRFR